MRTDDVKNFLEDYRKELHRSACELLLTGMPDVTEEMFAEFECTGSRLNYEKIYFTRRKYLAILGMEAILETRTGRAGRKECREDVLKKLCDVMESVCAEDTWALPAHVNCRVPGWQVTVDLFASETAQTLANLMDELWEELPGTLICRIQEEIRRRVLNPFFSAKVPYSWWEGSEMNWNAVCAGAIGSVCIHFYHRGLKLPEEFSVCIRRVCRSLTHYIDGFSEDGVCMEGLGYYTYGMAYYVNFMREMEEVCQKQNNPDIKLHRIAEFPGKCFFSDGRSISFSDGDSRDTWRVGIWCGLGAWFDGLSLPSLKSAAGVHTDSCYRFVNLKMDLFETEKYLSRANEKATPEKSSSAGIGTDGDETKRANCCETDANRKPHGRADIFSAAQWCIAESANGVGFACKGGHNDEPHNHNDIGHFIYESAGTVYLTDLGAGEYTADYFGADRYRILCNSSAGHSVPVLNGKYQKNGREYCCGAFEADREHTEQESVGSNAGRSDRQMLRVAMEIGSAWQKKEGGPAPSDSVQRTFHFDLQTGGLTVEDTFDRTQWGSVTEKLITQIPPRVEGNRVYLEENGGAIEISIHNFSHNAGKEGQNPEGSDGVLIQKNTEISAAEAETENPEIHVRKLEHRNHAGEAETVYAICWEVCGSKAEVFLRRGTDQKNENKQFALS